MPQETPNYVKAGDLISERFSDLIALHEGSPAPELPPRSWPVGYVDRPAAEERGVPRAHLDMLYAKAPDWPDLEMTRACKAVRAWDERGGRYWSLVLHGKARRGKSLAAAWWAVQSRAPAALAGTWTSAEDYVQLMRGDRSRAARTAGSLFLVIDDLGVEYLDAGGFALHAISRLICTRWDAGLRTLVTTNLDPRGIAGRYGDRVAGRLNEGALLEATGEVLGAAS